MPTRAADALYSINISGNVVLTLVSIELTSSDLLGSRARVWSCGTHEMQVL